MDNFIQYLFYFIIIAAFLNSIFGKKKKTEMNKVPQQPEPESFGTDTIDARTNTSGNQEEDFATLKEIENLFKKDIPVKPTAVDNVKTEESVANKDYIEERTKEFEMKVNKKKDNYDLFSLSIRKRLKSPESLKDYIIISEILGKPKAFE
jgi:hypothetical protein